MAAPAPSAGGLRERHREQVIGVLRRHGPASRAEIAALTSLSRATVSGLVGKLLYEGVAVEQAGQERGAAGAGRPAARLALNPGAGSAVGVDFGHTHLRVAVADLACQVLAEREARLDVDRAARDALDAAAALVADAVADAGVDRARIL